MSTVISVENISKLYRLGEIGTGSLAHDVNRWWHRVRGKEDPYLKIGESNDRTSSGSSDYVWSLRDVSFKVEQGEVLGIIGRNGAGKSTLLKILSRVTKQTTGRIRVKGRIASLLEVGTGFHPELTGRENIFLNGAILGMRKHEIQRKFDEIVDFSGCERYIDTPVKRYSSGMYVRLAFAVAAHLESEILILDEVLAVGDAEFQKKCLGKMKDVSRGGRTVLFVSHNLQAVQSLCTKAILLQSGTLIKDDNTSVVLDYYSQRGFANDTHWKRLDDKILSGLIFKEIEVSLQGVQPSIKLIIKSVICGNKKHKPAFLCFDILDSTGVAIMQAFPILEPFILPNSEKHEITTIIDLPPMVPGQYSLTAWVGSHNTETLDSVSECVFFDIINSPSFGRSFPHTSDHGYIVPSSTINKHLKFNDK